MTVDANGVGEFRWTARHTMALVILCLAQVLDGIDITIVNVALPAVRADLGFSASALPWVVNAYMVMFGGFLLLGGRVGDLYGRRRVLLAGVALFALASLVSGVVQNPGELIGARAVQGLAAALIAPMTLALIGVIFPAGRPRNRAFAAWASSYGISSALGLLLGGLLVDGPGWRWIFFVNVPIGVAVALATIAYVPGDRPVRRHRRFDVVGAVTSTAGVGLLSYAVLQTDGGGWGSARTLALLAASLLLLGYFVVHETRVASEPLVSVGLLRAPGVAGATAVSALRGAAMFALFFFATLYQQQVLHYSALQTGLNYLPMTAILIVAAAFGPILVRWIGIRLAVVAGSLIAAAGMVLFAGISANGSLLDVIVPSVVVCFGLAIVIVPTTIAALGNAPAEHAGVVSALQNVSLQLGGALGLAVLARLVTQRTTNELAAGRPLAVALTDGFGLSFAITGALMLGAAVLGAVLFGEQGRGERIDVTELQKSSIDT
ncbi:MFS transporter [Fodinicola feengrottensis]|uniref:MFS transporter n=1 Tax=Fodinicola feengrottensis TaxID=435914 RepID=A0ABN2GLP0_9ACTN